ncbi:MAG: DNA-deoxyinosine glycosylase [Ruminococcaceae bacterium]|nr:DNA-deoxyinosine glycosylase [Oscillospiraceae bacterium]
MTVHPIPPVYNKESKILILGSFPSVKSRESNFFYGHKQNRFWKLISLLLNENEPKTNEEKKDLLLKNRIALWDVVESCDIEGSADSSIKNVKPNDISFILENSKVERIYVNGRTAEKYYNKYIKPTLGKQAYCLPSTSPANAAWGMEGLLEAWRIIKENL